MTSGIYLCHLDFEIQYSNSYNGRDKGVRVDYISEI